jgi:hypothetical protein
MKNKINGVGNKFPTTAIIDVVSKGKPYQYPAKTPPLNSKIGRTDTINTITSLFNHAV